jgi:exonuclease III
MKILSLNLNHRSRLRKIPDQLYDVLTGLSPDVLCFNEYVDSDSHLNFKANLKTMRYKDISISAKIDGIDHNQILIATKTSHQLGELKGPAVTQHATTNFLHVITSEGLNIIGLRVPSIKGTELESYWVELVDNLNGLIREEVVVIGDFNCNPFKDSKGPAASMKSLESNSYTIPRPIGDFSYINYDGTQTSSIDHVVVSSLLNVSRCEYLEKFGEVVIAGKKDTSPITDHCGLLVEIN